jgi:hypothetical protein
VAEKYRASFVFDPWQSAQLSQKLKAQRVAVTEYVFSQQSIGRLAQRLYLLLSEHALDLPADDPELLAELAAVRIRETSPGTFRMDHDASGHDDRAVSLALAANELLEHVPRRGPKMVYHGAPERPAPAPGTAGPSITWVPGLFGARETGPKDWWGA